MTGITGGEATHDQLGSAEIRAVNAGDALQGDSVHEIPVPPPDRDLREVVERAREAAAESKRKNPIIAVLTSRRFWVLVLCCGIIYLMLAIPHFFWMLAPEIPLKVAVVDKTVPFKDRREHKSVFWILIQNRFVDPTQQGEKRWYDYQNDYIGFSPYGDPGTWAASLITQSALSDRDIMYISDTYGVYRADYVQFANDIASTIHSPKMFGGVTAEEAEATEWFAAQGRTIIAEFNTCASPTPPDVCKRMEEVLGITWSGWVGRYFVDFSDEKDVPDWLYKLYEKTYKKKWDIRGSGYMLCHNEEENFVILQDEKDVKTRGLEFVPLRNYTDNDVLQGVKPCTFTYWFDIITPNPDTEVLAEYQFNLTEDGLAKLKAKGLEPIFPALCRHRNKHTSYYISGEMVDFNRSMGPPDTRMSLYINRSFFGKAQASNESFFFWHTSYPLMTNIFRSESNRITGQPKRVYLWKTIE